MLRQLGHPVLQINVDDDQIDDAIDSAFQEYRDVHFDATEKIYLAYQLTANDISNTYVTVSDSIIGITRIFPFNQSNSAGNSMFNINYQMNLSLAAQLSNPGAISNMAKDYYVLKTNLALWDQIVNGLVAIRFNRHMSRLYIDMDWTTDVVSGNYIIIEGFQILDPETYTRVYNDKWLKKYATALLKKQWGTNMKKYQGVQLIGGVTMDGQTIYGEALAEIKELELEVKQKYSLPTEFFTG